MKENENKEKTALVKLKGHARKKGRENKEIGEAESVTKKVLYIMQTIKK